MFRLKNRYPYLRLTLHANKPCVCVKGFALYTRIRYFYEESCLEPVSKGISYFSIYTEVCLQLVRIRNIVVALIELLKKRNVDDCRHTYSTWQCLLVSTVQPTPECLYHTFTSKTPCTLYIEDKSRYKNPWK